MSDSGPNTLIVPFVSTWRVNVASHLPRIYGTYVEIHRLFLIIIIRLCVNFLLEFRFVQKVFRSRDVSTMNDFSSNLLKNR